MLWQGRPQLTMRAQATCPKAAACLRACLLVASVGKPAAKAICRTGNIHSRADSSELILAMRLDCHIRGRVRHAREAEALVHLVIVQEGLVRLVDRAGDDLACTARA